MKRVRSPGTGCGQGARSPDGDLVLTPVTGAREQGRPEPSCWGLRLESGAAQRQTAETTSPKVATWSQSWTSYLPSPPSTEISLDGTHTQEHTSLRHFVSLCSLQGWRLGGPLVSPAHCPLPVPCPTSLVSVQQRQPRLAPRAAFSLLQKAPCGGICLPCFPVSHGLLSQSFPAESQGPPCLMVGSPQVTSLPCTQGFSSAHQGQHILLSLLPLLNNDPLLLPFLPPGGVQGFPRGSHRSDHRGHQHPSTPTQLIPTPRRGLSADTPSPPQCFALTHSALFLGLLHRRGQKTDSLRDQEAAGDGEPKQLAVL